MLEQFLNFIRKEKLGDNSRSYLLTVSGGVDSIVMCDLFFKAGFSFGIAHCNFKLRGEESEEDEEFVKSVAGKYKVAFHKKSFSTKAYSERKKISIQMSARELRYEWLKRLAKDKKYDCIATAHHLDDSIETFFINLLRGTGIAGLQGIQVKQGNIIRPLLFANKKMIHDYADENKLQWREDSSNFTDKYLRNSIRHHLIPSLKRLNKGFEKTITKELSYFKEAGDIFKKFIEEKKKEIIVEDGKNILLNIKKLKDSGHAETVLHEILRAYDFNPETTELIAQRMYTTAGKKFLSPTYRLIKDREFFILTPTHPAQEHPPLRQVGAPPSKGDKEKFLLKKNQTEFQNENLKLKMEIMDGNISEVKDKSPQTAYIDLAKLEFPLTLRKWKQGDFFFPLGMKGKKKLSDFFIDIKLPLNNKEETWVLESSTNIVWVIGHRIDERHKITPRTKKIYKVARVA
ncbi:MAG: tRNA lysidine(34) synthetase TilS [Bacteroidetes bacterium]|nr:tRNA lysidine(34) synthetase TilS [Bacteroidota bacterium]